MLFQRPGIDADPDRDHSFFAGVDHGFDLGLVADVSGVDPDLVATGVNRLKGEAVVEMDIRNERDAGLFLDLFDGSCVFKINNGDADKSRSRLFEGVDLADGLDNVFGFGIGHALDQDLVVSAQNQVSDLDRSGFTTLVHFLITRVDYTPSERHPVIFSARIP